MLVISITSKTKLVTNFAELEDFEKSRELKLKSADQSAVDVLNLPHAEERLKMREDHLNELADVMRQLDPEQVGGSTWFNVVLVTVVEISNDHDV